MFETKNAKARRNAKIYARDLRGYGDEQFVLSVRAVEAAFPELRNQPEWVETVKQEIAMRQLLKAA